MLRWHPPVLPLKDPRSAQSHYTIMNFAPTNVLSPRCLVFVSKFSLCPRVVRGVPGVQNAPHMGTKVHPVVAPAALQEPRMDPQCFSCQTLRKHESTTSSRHESTASSTPVEFEESTIFLVATILGCGRSMQWLSGSSREHETSQGFVPATCSQFHERTSY